MPRPSVFSTGTIALLANPTVCLQGEVISALDFTFPPQSFRRLCIPGKGCQGRGTGNASIHYVLSPTVVVLPAAKYTCVLAPCTGVFTTSDAILGKVECCYLVSKHGVPFERIKLYSVDYLLG